MLINLIEFFDGFIGMFYSYCLSFLILIPCFVPKFNFKKFLISLLIAIGLIPINLLISIFYILMISGEGINNPTFFNYNRYFEYILYLNILIILFLLYKKRYYLAVIVPKSIEILMIIVLAVLRG